MDVSCVFKAIKVYVCKCMCLYAKFRTCALMLLFTVATLVLDIASLGGAV